MRLARTWVLGFLPRLGLRKNLLFGRVALWPTTLALRTTEVEVRELILA
jgi:hypothetical protein